MKNIALLIICIFFTVSCKTVKENEEEIKDENIIDYGSFQKITTVDNMGDTVLVFEGDETAIMNHILGYDNLSEEEIRVKNNISKNEHCKEYVSLFPNPTSNFVTLEFDYWKGIDIAPSSEFEMSFQFDLIFDGKIIYKDNTSNYKGKIIIPEHILQKEGTYVVAYKFYQNGFINCENTIQFMVIKRK